MSFTELDIDVEGNLNAQGKLPYTLQECRSVVKIPEVLKELVQKFILIQKSYGMALHDDSKMMGNERFTLRDLIDDCIDLVIVMRTKVETDETYAMSAPELGRRAQFQIDLDRWKATGTLGANRNLKNNQFSIWLERMAKERLPAIIKYFGQISLDGVLTAEEIAGFNKLLDRLFFSMVIVREEILSGEME
ncbi:MAG TPA: hypothetical protein PKE49_03295 [Leptospiraceae bacterium]|nr:hypothetical protein [Leptospirales bacterium]HMX55521.1 hypothetical protein [Leptospiraceae bacterium]HMY46912.1 hypothetical protein [Leptospiraceae bacterium]HMZ35834.1 hypothetical protein [Leptospiraceae bacterium]HNJ33137.1 hypothetical protein [Leptospiraceae bacterium]